MAAPFEIPVWAWTQPEKRHSAKMGKKRRILIDPGKDGLQGEGLPGNKCRGLLHTDRLG
jgi:hypothetical protein